MACLHVVSLMVMTTEELLDKNRTAILELAASHGAEEVRLFGSGARSEESAQSDLDLLVRMKSGCSFFDFVGLWQALEDLLDCKVDLVSEGGLSPYLRDTILQEARPL